MSLVLAIAMASLFSISVSAVSLTPQQSAFSFDPVDSKGGVPFTYDLTPGSKMTNAMRVNNFSDAEMSLKLKVNLPEGEDWFTLAASDVTVAPQSSENVDFTIVIPADAELGSTYKASVSLMMIAAEEEAAVPTEGGAQIGVSTAYARNIIVNVASGEAVVVDQTPADESSNVWPFIKENINTILLVLIFLLVAKMACCRGTGKKK